MAVDVTNMISTIGSLASMAGLYIAIKQERRVLSDQEIAHRLKEVETKVIDVNFEDLTRVLVKIPEPILDAVNKKLQDAIGEYAKKIRSPSTHPLDYSKLHELAREAMCNLLDIIKRHGGGDFDKIDNIQGDSCKDLWEMYDCLNYFGS